MLTINYIYTVYLICTILPINKHNNFSYLHFKIRRHIISNNIDIYLYQIFNLSKVQNK